MKRPITVISVISIFLFIIALAWFGIGIYEDGKSGSEQNSRIFETLVFKTMNAAGTSKVGTPEFSKKFIDAIGNIENYSALKLSVNGKLVYSYPPAGFSIPSAAVTNSFKETNSTRGGLLITVSASMYAIKANSVYHYAKFAFVLIFLGTSISLILLLILSGNKNSKIKTFFKKNKGSPKDDFFDFDDKKNDAGSIFNLPEDEEIIFGSEDDSISAENKDENQKINSDENFDLPESKTEIQDDFEKIAPAQKNENDFFGNNQFLPFKTDISEDDFEISDAESENPNELKENEDEKNQEEDFLEEIFDFESDEKLEDSQENQQMDFQEKTENDDSKTFDFSFIQNNENEKTELEKKSETEQKNSKTTDFDLNASSEAISPATGLKLQSALLPELEEKIKKSHAENSELTLALFKVNALDRGNSISNKIVAILKNKIENPEEIFEFNADGYAIILEDKDLNACADIFDEIYEKAASFLKENNSANEVVIGLSSLNKRNIDAKKLESEADMALAYALEDPDSPIIAFRPNSKK